MKKQVQSNTMLHTVTKQVLEMTHPSGVLTSKGHHYQSREEKEKLSSSTYVKNILRRTLLDTQSQTKHCTTVSLSTYLWPKTQYASRTLPNSMSFFNTIPLRHHKKISTLSMIKSLWISSIFP